MTDNDTIVLKNRAFLSAYRKGRAAASNGHERVSPYPDHRMAYRNSVTFSVAFSRYWLEGYDDAASGCPERYTP